MTQKHRQSAPKSGHLFDELLVVMIQQGNKQALERLHARWDARLIRAAARYTGDADFARDIAQDCWLGIWKSIGTLRDPSRFRGFAFAILARRGADHLARIIPERERACDSQPETPHAASQEDSAAIQQAFGALSPDHRLAAHLHFVEGLTLTEIAAVQKIAVGTAKSRIFTARRLLKWALSASPQGAQS